ncbi:MAG: TlpA family protein disulfide reductase [Candidatus Kapabacteria bacterium]|nr:TlpA family protein disulfide reductase [Ignavibacteriota bacterium]MCW5884151.1 TlpA family protein disulfide reductase [Candidatus Kapabacteria bacterium]
MKKVATIIILTAISLISFAYLTANEPSGKKIPNVKVKDLKGSRISTSDFENGGKPIVINFWATWCKPCLLELNTIHDLYPDWKDETGVKIIAISIDDTRNSSKVAPFVRGRGWKYEVYLDENSDLRRALNVNNPPHTFLLNGKGEIVWEHNGYAPGDEKTLYNEIKKLSGKK